MDKYQFLENSQHNPIIINYGELGPCQLLQDHQRNELCVLKLSQKLQAVKDIELLTKLRHPNLIKILDYLHYEQNTLIIYQLLTNGDLMTKIRCKQLKRAAIPGIFKGICSAVKYLHENNIIHRNLKSQTVLLDNQMNPKIIDFGLSSQSSKFTKRLTFCGCYSYMAPQILLRREYDYKVDIWALGAILYEMVYGLLPFEGQNENQILMEISRSQIYDKYIRKGSVDELIRMILSFDPRFRPQVSEILAHPYLNQKQLPNSKYAHNEIQPSISRIKRKNVYSSMTLGPKNFKPCKIERKQLARVRSKSIFEKITTFACDKFQAIFDSQKISTNPHYNYIAPHNS